MQAANILLKHLPTKDILYIDDKDLSRQGEHAYIMTQQITRTVLRNTNVWYVIHNRGRSFILGPSVKQIVMLLPSCLGTCTRRCACLKLILSSRVMTSIAQGLHKLKIYKCIMRSLTIHAASFMSALKPLLHLYIRFSSALGQNCEE